MLLRDLYERDRILLVDGPLDWRDALRRGVEPLIRDGSVHARYADDLIANVEQFGPYIVLAPDLAMPHATASSRWVNRSAISFMRVREPVCFDGGREARVFFTLSDRDDAEHLANMRRLYDVISRPEVVRMLAEAECPEDLLSIDAAIERSRGSVG